MLRSKSLLTRAAAVIAGATLIAACGSGSHHSTNHPALGTVTINGQRMPLAQANQDMLHFASCMKTHGVQGLPSPVAAPGAFKQSLSATTPSFTSAMTACGHLLPGQTGQGQGAAHTHQQIEAMLAFARCMRGHGFSRFPDPTTNGSLSHEMLAQAGIDLHQPAVVRSADSCTAVTHGMLNRASVARFIAGQ